MCFVRLRYRGIDRYRSGRSPNGKNFPLLVGQVPASRHRARIVPRRMSAWSSSRPVAARIQGSVRRSHSWYWRASRCMNLKLVSSYWHSYSSFDFVSGLTRACTPALSVSSLTMSDKDLLHHEAQVWSDSNRNVDEYPVTFIFPCVPPERWSPTMVATPTKTVPPKSMITFFPTQSFDASGISTP